MQKYVERKGSICNLSGGDRFKLQSGDNILNRDFRGFYQTHKGNFTRTFN
jgi:hypothetical protein